MGVILYIVFGRPPCRPAIMLLIERTSNFTNVLLNKYCLQPNYYYCYSITCIQSSTTDNSSQLLVNGFYNMNNIYIRMSKLVIHNSSPVIRPRKA